MTARCRGRVTAAAALSGLLAAARWHTRGAQQQAATVGTPPPRATLQQARPEWCTAALRSGGPFALPAGTGGGPGNQKPGIAFAMKEAQRLRRALLVPLIAQAGMRMGGLDRLDQAPWLLPLGHAHSPTHWCSAALRAGHCVRCSPLPPPWHSAGPALGLGALAGDPVMARGSEDDARVAAALLGLWERQRNCTAQLGGKGKRMSPSSRPLCPVVLLRGGPRQHRLAILPAPRGAGPPPRRGRRAARPSQCTCGSRRTGGHGSKGRFSPRWKWWRTRRAACCAAAPSSSPCRSRSGSGRRQRCAPSGHAQSSAPR
eukprot:TRINITY_DN18038_c0_g1_i1.p4 TRINITY_DN18038_c0_g1~~TRINITY_DN18038_c0_g1_i1.p4  ORF type:complete len:340 (+),score=40.11 TRINITY_DN18038_c0_g1_i1:76-1020(+)